MQGESEEAPPGNGRRIAEEHMAIRLNDMDLQRAVEQVAILISLFVEVQETNVHRTTTAKMALASMMGYLSHAWCRGRIVHADYKHGDNEVSRQFWRLLESAGWLPGTFGIAPPGDDWALDIVMSPLDGSRSFVDGQDSGSIAILGAGRPGAFLPEQEGLAEDYLVVTAHPGALHAKGLKDLARGAGLLETADKVLDGKRVKGVMRADARRAEQLARERAAARLKDNRLKEESSSSSRLSPLEGLLHGLVEVLYQELSSGHLVRSWATSSNQSRDFAFKRIRPALRTRFKLRTFNGSSVAAGISPFFRHLTIDGYTGVIRRTHAILLAIAAQATGGHMLAIPVARKGDTEDYDLAPELQVLDEDDFVEPDQDVFLLATGVSENLLVEGVRFRADDQVSTHTLCLRTATRSSRFISHHHDLQKKQFRLLSRDFGPLEELFTRIEEKKKLVLERHYLTDPRGAGPMPSPRGRRRALTRGDPAGNSGT